MPALLPLRALAVAVLVGLLAGGGCLSGRSSPARQAQRGGIVPVGVAGLESQTPVHAGNEDDEHGATAARGPSDASVRFAGAQQELLPGDEAEPLPEPDEPGRADPPAPLDPFVDDEPFVSAHPEQYTVNFATVLAAAAGDNPQVAFAYERIDEAFAQYRQARVLWLPSMNAGFNYHKHEGRIQDVVGDVIETSRGALYAGVGAQAVGAGAPAVPGLVMRFHLRDAIFQPEIAARVAAAQQEAAAATTNDVLLEAALAYLELLNALQGRSIAVETQGNTRSLLELTEAFARTGVVPQADADRMQAEMAVRDNEAERAVEGVEVAMARLAEVTQLDPTVRLVPQEPTIVPIDLVVLDVEPRELVVQGLSNRPELAERRLLVEEAVQRLRREGAAPLIPSIFMGTSYGALGGGLGSDMINWGDRFNFDVAAHWELRNLGLGEKAARDQARSRVRQAELQQIEVMNRVAREVIEAHAQARARKRQVGTAERGIEAASLSYKRNLQRMQEGEGLPIEVMQSVQALDQVRREYLRAVVQYNEAQFSLQRALGWPVSL